MKRRKFIASIQSVTVGIYITSINSCKNESNSFDAIYCWGDSLTEGAGGKGMSYPRFVEIGISRQVKNFGIAGQKTRQIVARQGGIPITLSISNGKFDRNSALDVDSISVDVLSTPSNNNEITLSGSIDDHKCTLIRNASGKDANRVEKYRVIIDQKTNINIDTNLIFLPNTLSLNKSGIHIFWMGRNDSPNFSGLEELFDKAIDNLNNNNRFLVIGILNSLEEKKGTSNYDKIINFNNTIQKKYVNNYIPISPPTLKELTAIAYIASQIDLQQINQGIFPSGLRSDSIHLNKNGYRIIANRVIEMIKQKQW